MTDRVEIIRQLRKLGTPQSIIDKLRKAHATAQEWEKYLKLSSELPVKARTYHHRITKTANSSSDIIGDAAIWVNLHRPRVQAARERDEEQIDAVDQAIDDEAGQQVLTILQRDYDVDTKGADYFGKPVNGLTCPMCFASAVVVVAYPNGTGNAWCKKNRGGCGWHLTKDDQIKAFPKVDLKPYLGEPRWLQRLMGSTSAYLVAKEIIWKLEHKRQPWATERISDHWLAEKTSLSLSTITRVKKRLKQKHGSWFQCWPESGNATRYGVRPDRLLQAFLDLGDASQWTSGAQRQRRQKWGTT
jgi:hypothetical protein